MEPVIYWSIFAVAALIQVFLSLRRNKVLGMLLPIILFLIIVYIAIITAIRYNSTFTSFPLDAFIFINTIEYLVPLVVGIVIYFVCLFIKKKRTE